VHHVRGYYVRLETVGPGEAAELAADLSAHEAWVHREANVVSVVLPHVEAEPSADWAEELAAELIFWLRTRAASNPARRVTVLAERPLDVAAELFPRAS
jgi:hypothetical protein